MSDSTDDGYVVSDHDVDPDVYEYGKRTFRQYRLGHATVGDELGASLYDVEGGHATWPAHYHTGNEEGVFVLEGQVSLVHGTADECVKTPLKSGDYVALPTGPAHAHELGVTGDEAARFLVVSTMREPDFTLLTDAGKVHLIAGDPPGEYEDRYVSRTLDVDAQVPYWHDADQTAEVGNAVEGADTDHKDLDEDGEPDAESPMAAQPSAGERTDSSLPIVSPPERTWTHHDHSDRGRGGHRFRRTQLGAAAGGEQLGASLYDVPPGKRTWLPHYHLGNAEAAYVLDGAGTVTLGVDRTEHAVSSGDYVALPRGEVGFHDVVAGEDGIRYLMVSTMNEPDVTVYPDDGKVGIYGGSAPGGPDDERTLSTYLDADAEVEYWDG